jgi:hypothetical protein
MTTTPQQVQRVLEELGIDSGDGVRQDAKYTAFVTGELQAVEANVYKTEYPELKAKALFPVDHSTPSGAQTTAYDMMDQFGEAAVISNYADDLPLVDVMKERFTIMIQSLGDGYQYSIQDIRAAQFAGANLDQQRADTARQVVEFKLEQIAAQGLAIGGLKGALKHPNVPLYAPITGTWSSATAAQMYADLNSFLNQFLAANLDVWIPNTLILDPTSYRLASQATLNTTTGETALAAFQRVNKIITTVESWTRCSNMDVAGTGPRFMLYKKDPKVIVFDIPQEFEQFPPQAQNLAFKVPCHARCAGIKIRYPLACAYMDGC